jgi:hypothetical protein
MKINLKDIHESIKGDWQIILSGIELIRDSQSYKLKSTHGLSNQEYEDKCDKVMRNIGNILVKMKIYESVLAHTFRARLLKKANKLHKKLIENKGKYE